MLGETLDELDKNIIYSLQRDARNTSSSTIAEEMDVSASTVRNRIKRLEDLGVIQGYRVEIDYEAAGYQLYTLIECTVPAEERESRAQAALDVAGVAGVREIMTGERNVHVSVVGADHDDLSRINRELTEVGLTIEDEHLIRDEHVCPFHGFAADSRAK